MMERQRLDSERGAVFIFVGLAILALVAFLVFVIDQGLLMVARGQAQNAADAGALAGAVARAFDDPNDPPAGNGPAAQSATLAAQTNTVWDGPGVAQVSWACPPGVLGWCVRVDVYRNGQFGSATLPTVFGSVLNITSQRVRATATAEAAAANGSNCLKPWIIPDRFSPYDPDTPFDPAVHTYVAPTPTDPGTGWSTAHIGTTLLLKAGNPHQAISASEFFEMENANDYLDSITGCVITKGIGDSISFLPGNRVGPTNKGVDILTADGPVTVVIAMFSPADFEASRQHGKFDLHIVNMLGFRIEGRKGNAVYGTIVGAPGEILPGAGPPVGGTGALVKVIRLVR